MKTSILRLTLIAVACGLLLAVSSMAQTSPSAAASAGVTFSDLDAIADAITSSLITNVINQGKLQSSPPNGETTLAIGRITNNTSSRIDISVLVQKISMRLLPVGKIRLIAGQRLTEDKDQGKPQPDYILTGAITEERITEGGKKRSNYVCQFELNTKSNVLVWGGEKIITK